MNKNYLFLSIICSVASLAVHADQPVLTMNRWFPAAETVSSLSLLHKQVDTLPPESAKAVAFSLTEHDIESLKTGL